RWFFFFSSRRRHTRSDRDWSSDVCSSDLGVTVEHWTYCAVCGERLVASSDPALNPACPACGWFRPTYALPVVLVLAHTPDGQIEIGRASCRERGGASVVAGVGENKRRSVT